MEKEPKEQLETLQMYKDAQNALPGSAGERVIGKWGDDYFWNTMIISTFEKSPLSIISMRKGILYLLLTITFPFLNVTLSIYWVFGLQLLIKRMN